MGTNFLKINKGINLNGQSSAPSSPTNGDIYYDTALNTFQQYVNGAWYAIVGDSLTQTLSGKQIQYSSSTDSTTTGTSATLQAFTSGIVRLTNGSLSSISGIPAGSSGQALILENEVGSLVIIKDNDSGAAVGNKIRTGTGGSIAFANGASIALIYDATDSVWQIVGGTGSGSGSGVKNYLSAITTSQSSTPNTGNGNFELGSTSGWGKISVGAVSGGFVSGAITEGSAASITTFNTINSNHISGTYSLRTQALGGWSSGQGFMSSAFNIDNVDQAKVLSFKFAYKVVTPGTGENYSGTSSNTFAVVIYDVTNSAWIQPAGVWNITQTNGIGVSSGTFQTSSNGTQYRIGVVCVNSTSTNTDIYFDDFFVGPQVSVNAPAMTDLGAVSWTPTGTWTTNTSYTGRWKRLGDIMYGRVTVSLSGAPDNTALIVNLPSGYSMDTSKMQATQNRDVVGRGSLFNAGQQQGFQVVYYTSTQLHLLQSGISGSRSDLGSGFNATSPVTFASGDTLDFWFEVPIVGWSSNSVMSNDTDTRVVDLQVNNGSSITPSGTISSTFAGSSAINFNTTPFKDSHGSYSGGSYTVPVAGDYDCSTFLEVSHTLSTGTFIAIAFAVNGTLRSVNAVKPVTTGNAYPYGQILLSNLKAGDIITVRLFTDVTSPALAGSIINNLNIKRLSGPSVIAASELIAASYGSSSGQGISGTYSTLVMATKNFDTHNSYNASTGVYTVPASGIYEISAQYTVSTSSIQSYYINIRKNSSAIAEHSDVRQSTNAAFECPNINFLVRLNAGDIIDIQAKTDGETPSLTANTTQNFFTIQRIGI